MRIDLRRPTWSVYRIYDDNDVLLYVGYTSQLIGARLAAHRAAQPWWSEAASIDIEGFGSEVAARRAEVEAINAESPKYNVRKDRPLVLPTAVERARYPQEYEAEDVYRALNVPVREDPHRHALLVRALLRNGISIEEIERGTGLPDSLLRSWAVLS